jgi:hypothetical protein
MGRSRGGLTTKIHALTDARGLLYRARNRIERFFNRNKHFRRLATRYEKHASNFLAMLKLAATHLWLAIMSLCPRPRRPH